MGKSDKREWTDDESPSDPEPSNRGDSVERTGLWKAGNGGGGTHFPDHR